MKTMKLGVVLLALLLAGMAMVPMVSAQNIPAADLALASELNAVALNPSNNQLSQLQFNSTQQPATVTGEFQSDATTRGSQITSLMATSVSPEVSKIPFGAIVYHSNDGMTTVFDSSGQQLFRVEDDTAPLVNTPNGALPATSVFEVPDKSLVVDNGNAINVFYGNQRILTIMGSSSGTLATTQAARSLTSTPPYDTTLGYWIEWGETNPISSIDYFTAQWKVPKSPTAVHNYSNSPSLDGTKSTIWIGLQKGSSPLLQPVLEWYVKDKAGDPNPTIANWSLATWYVNGSGVHSTRRYGIESNDLIQGTMSVAGTWYGATTDLDSGYSSTLFLNTTQSKKLTTTNLKPYFVLEGWALYSSQTTPYNASYIPGNITFKTITMTSDGTNVIPSTIYGYYNNLWDPTQYGLSVTNSSWPTNITLNTGNI